MAVDVGTVRGLIELRDEFSNKLDLAQRKLQDTGKKMEQVGSRMSSVSSGLNKALAGFGIGFSVAAVVGGLRSVTRLATEQAQAMAQLEQGLRSTGGAVGFTADELAKMASELQRVTTFGDETIIRAQSILLTFTKIGQESFPRVTKAALDLATRMGGDLQSAALQLGKALNDPVANLSALSRAGIQFTEDQKAMIKVLHESGDAASAQALILKELATQFGGSAEAAAKAAGGGMKQFMNTMGDLGEVIGSKVLPPLEAFLRGVRDVIEFGPGMAGAIRKNAVEQERLWKQYGDSTAAVDHWRVATAEAKAATLLAAEAQKDLSESLAKSAEKAAKLRAEFEALVKSVTQPIKNPFSFVESHLDRMIAEAKKRWDDFLNAGQGINLDGFGDKVERATTEALLESLGQFEQAVGRVDLGPLNGGEPSDWVKFATAFTSTLKDGLKAVAIDFAQSLTHAIMTDDLKNFFDDLGRRVASQIASVLQGAALTGLQNMGKSPLASSLIVTFATVFAAGVISVLTKGNNAVIASFQGVIDAYSGATTVFRNAVTTFEGAAMLLAEVARNVRSELRDLFAPIGGFRLNPNAAPSVLGPGTGGAGGGGGGGGAGTIFDFNEMLRVRAALAGILGGVLNDFSIFVQQLGDEWTVAISGIAAGFGETLEEATRAMLDQFARNLPSMIESGLIVLEGIPDALVAVLKKGVAQSFDELKEALEVATKVFVKSLGSVVGGLFVNLNQMISDVAEAIRVGLPLDVAKQAVLNSLNDFKNAIAGAELFPQFASKREVLKLFSDALERLGIVGEEARQQLREAALSVRFFNMSLKANVLGQLARLAQQFGVSSELIIRARILETKLQFFMLRAQLKVLGLWEKHADLWRELFRLAKQEARKAGAGFQHGSEGLRDFGSGTVAMLHGREEVLTEHQGRGVAEMVKAALSRPHKDEQMERLIGKVDGLSLALIRQQALLTAGFDSARAKGFA